MDINKCIKQSFSVIGKEGSTNEGAGFIDKLWKEADNNFGEVISLAKKDENGNIIGIWGAMNDFSRNFQPWDENNPQGLYLAGVEVPDSAQPPQNWVKWAIPGYEYLCVKVQNDVMDMTTNVMNYISANNMQLTGAVNDFINPQENGQLYMYFPVKRL